MIFQHLLLTLCISIPLRFVFMHLYLKDMEKMRVSERVFLYNLLFSSFMKLLFNVSCNTGLEKR